MGTRTSQYISIIGHDLLRETCGTASPQITAISSFYRYRLLSTECLVTSLIVSGYVHVFSSSSCP